MATQYSDMLIQIVADVGDVNPPQVETVFRRCLSSFMKKSQVWRTKYTFDLASATPAPGTRTTLVAAYTVAAAAAAAAPNNLTLAQAAADAWAAAYVNPQWTLTRPLKTAAIVDPPTAAVYYSAIASGIRVNYSNMDAAPHWKINPPSAAGGNQTLEMLPPIADMPNGAVTAQVFWTPLFDVDPALAVPDWIFERYGNIVCDWTVGTLWMRRRGRRSDQQLGIKMSNDAMIDTQRVRARTNAEDPLTMMI